MLLLWPGIAVSVSTQVMRMSAPSSLAASGARPSYRRPDEAVSGDDVEGITATRSVRVRALELRDVASIEGGAPSGPDLASR